MQEAKCCVTNSVPTTLSRFGLAPYFVAFSLWVRVLNCEYLQLTHDYNILCQFWALITQVAVLEGSEPSMAFVFPFSCLQVHPHATNLATCIFLSSPLLYSQSIATEPRPSISLLISCEAYDVMFWKSEHRVGDVIRAEIIHVMASVVSIH